MNMKRIILLVLTYLLLFCLTACQLESTAMREPSTITTADGAASGKGDTFSLRITWAEYSGRGEAIQRIISNYNNAYNHSITMLGGDEDLQTIQALLDGNAPIVYVLPYRYVQLFGMRGDLMDLTQAFELEQAAYYPQIWALGGIDGVTYGIPWIGHAMCLLYNTSLLQIASVDATSINSLDALVDAMAQIQSSTDARGFGLVGAASNDISWMVNQFIYGFGGALVSDDGETVAINSEQSRAALDFYKNVLGAYAQPTWQTDTGAEVMNLFRKQEVAFEIQGIWGVTDIQKNGSPFEVGILSLSDIGLCAEVGPMMLAIPAHMDEALQHQALALIRYLISPDAQSQILLGEYSPEHDAYYPFRTPIRHDGSGGNAFFGMPEYVRFIEGFQNPSIDVPTPAWQIIKDTYYESGLHQVMLGELSIDDFLRQIETVGNEILRNNQ